MKRAVVIVLLVALVLGGGGLTVWQLVAADDDRDSGTLGTSSESPNPTPSPSEDQGGDQEAPDPALQPFYDQRLAWTECGERECARLEVPLDYDEPDGQTIELAVLKVVAGTPDARVGSLVVNPGGPGASGTSYADQAETVFGQPLRDRFDIIGFDPRGTGSSTAVDCLTDEELDAYIAVDPDPDDAAEVQAYEEQLERIGAGCAERSGDLAAHVSTVEAARDMDVLRAALGEDQLAYLGASYGTKLGATYADLFPDRAGRLVLDGAVDLSLPGRQLALEQAEGFEVALTAYVDDCLQGDCFLGESREEALASISTFLDDVDREPLQVGDRELTVGHAFYGIVTPLYNADYWSFLTSALQSAIEGDGTALLQLSDLYNSRNADGSYSDNSSEAFYAIGCLDDPSSTPVDEIEGEFADFERASPTFGRVFAWGLAGCSGLEVEGDAPRRGITAEGADPLLVVGTTRDPATPYRWSRALAEQLDPAVLITRDGDGHTGYNQGNACVDDIVEGYLIDGTVPETDVNCPAP